MRNQVYDMHTEVGFIELVGNCLQIALCSIDHLEDSKDRDKVKRALDRLVEGFIERRDIVRDQPRWVELGSFPRDFICE